MSAGGYRLDAVGPNHQTKIRHQTKIHSGSASGVRMSLTRLYRSLANFSRMAAVLLCRASRMAWYSSRAAGASWVGVYRV